MISKALVLLVTATAVALAIIALGQRGGNSASDARAAALHWVGVGVAQEPRRDEDEWEVDIVRPDGSLVEVTIGSALEARGFDEERGAAGRRAPDELDGSSRARAILAALAETGGGRVLSVERDGPGVIEVGIRTDDGGQVEVELDKSLRVVEVEPEDPRDE